MLVTEIRKELTVLFPLVQRSAEFVSEANTRFPQFFIRVLTTDIEDKALQQKSLNYFCNLVYRDRANPSTNTTNLQASLSNMGFSLTTQFNKIDWFNRTLNLKNKRYEIVDNIVQFFFEVEAGFKLEELETVKQQHLEIDIKIEKEV